VALPERLLPDLPAISHGASRLQEVLADRWAASLYGAEAFEAGLRHVIERSVRFDAHVGATLKEVLDTKAALANLYRYEPATPPSESDLERACQEALGRPASPYDSHPSPADRFAAVRATPTRGAGPSDDDAAETWSLFTDRAAVERVMTTVVRQGVQANHGVEIPAGAPEPAEAR